MTRAIFLNGAVGVGKTTALGSVGDHLTTAARPHALIDLDWLRRVSPAPADDPFQLRLELRGGRGERGGHRRRGAGPGRVLEERSARVAYVEALGCPLTVVRLVAERAVVRARLTARHAGDVPGEAWHLQRFDELTRVLDAAGVDDAVVDVGLLAPQQVGALVLAAVPE